MCIKSEKFPSQHLHISIFRLVMNHGLTLALFLQYSCDFSRVPPTHCLIQFLFAVKHEKESRFPWLVERVDLSSCNLEVNVSGEWDINSAYLSLCRVGMTRHWSDSSIVFRWKKPAKFARALHRDSVPLIEYMKTKKTTWLRGIKNKVIGKQLMGILARIREPN